MKNKKKGNKRARNVLIVSAVVMVGLFIAVGSDQGDYEPETVDRPSTEAIETKAGEPEEVTLTEDQVKQNELDEAERIKSESIDEYKNYIVKHSTDIGGYFRDFSELVSNPQNDDVWMIKLAVAIQQIKDSADEYLNKTDIPEGFESMDNEYKSAMREFKTAMDIIPKAIDNNDTVMINRATEHILTGNEYVSKATTLISNID